ncbi:PTS sugar transporter subunit IIB [Desmospora profundinema]|uniref:PTS system cellobiose-specific IIB component n=1 Tax=Desmospora profundinema TaxID=1571184 RepID=A0ABU1IQP6_9BACL|nr:PTS sugar transporter subunit IIB [Desmospora profundinema]MDR6226743.1 PTS system cellobiose-specific IIB component [Desmospora profundinema]
MNILLVCAAGMSTSLLVSKMEEAAREKGWDVQVKAVPADEAKAHLDDVDVLLLGPQVRYKLPQFKQMGEERGIPVDVINPADYGCINGRGVLEFAYTIKSEEAGSR